MATDSKTELKNEPKSKALSELHSSIMQGVFKNKAKVTTKTGVEISRYGRGVRIAPKKRVE